MINYIIINNTLSTKKDINLENMKMGTSYISPVKKKVDSDKL